MLSGLVVILAIFFEGKIKSKRIIPKQIFKLTVYGWVLIGLYLSFTAGTIYTSYKSIIVSEEKSDNDSIISAKIINELKVKRLQDSIEIYNLKRITIENGLKSDSIKVAVVDNAIKALNEQKLIIERQHQNIYIQFKSEIEDNLEKIFNNYDEKRIKGFTDTLGVFISVRLNNTFLIEYKDISSNEVVIEYLLNLNEIIEMVNFYIEASFNSANLKSKATNTNMFLMNIERLKPDLIMVFSRTNNIEFYKDYENLKFQDSGFKPYSESKVREYLLLNGLIKTGKIKVLDKPTKKGATN